VLTVALWLALGAEPAPKPKLVVLSVDAAANVDPATRAGFDDAIVATVAKTAAFDVVSSREVQVLLGIERQKQLLGCADDGSSCLAELSGALGARFVLSGTLAPLGGTWQLTLQMQDTTKSVTVGRSSRIAKNLDGLRAVLPFAVAEVTGTPPPPPPSKVGPLAMVAGGALLAAIGGTVLFDALTEAAAIRRELQFGSAPRTRASYLDDEAGLQAQANLGVLGLAFGGAVLAAGIILWPPDLARGVALVPTPSGAFVVGVF
jgi:TolB-like protein